MRLAPILFSSCEQDVAISIQSPFSILLAALPMYLTPRTAPP